MFANYFSMLVDYSIMGDRRELDIFKLAWRGGKEMSNWSFSLELNDISIAMK